ncbi:MAG: Rieske (2Fe-2S) protein [Deltaproteobacteria bacterium]|nr:Rieske (2Fe-2S) protein [Deltaproteobacteria bacterium]
MDTTRRGFLKLVAGVAAGLALSGRRVVLAAGKVSLPLDKASELTAVGGVKAVRLGGRDLVLVRDSATIVKALDARCTHQGCIVMYTKATKLLDCPCHGSQFRLDGRPAKGPAPSPLTTYPATLSGNAVVIDLP